MFFIAKGDACVAFNMVVWLCVCSATRVVEKTRMYGSKEAVEDLVFAGMEESAGSLEFCIEISRRLATQARSNVKGARKHELVLRLR